MERAKTHAKGVLNVRFGEGGSLGCLFFALPGSEIIKVHSEESIA